MLCLYGNSQNVAMHFLLKPLKQFETMSEFHLPLFLLAFAPPCSLHGATNCTLSCMYRGKSYLDG